MPKTQEKIHIYGTGGHALSALDILLSKPFPGKIEFIEEHNPSINTFHSYKVLPKIPTASKTPLFLALGNNNHRKNLFLNNPSCLYTSVIAKNAYISNLAFIGKNIFIGHHAHIGPDAVIGDNSIVNTAAIIEHEVIIGKHCHIAVNATITGKVTIGDEVFVGAGAIIKNNISICSNVIVGAGAIVVKNIDESGTYIGIPAKKL